MICLQKYVLVEEMVRDEHAALYRGHRRADGAPVLIRRLAGRRPTPREISSLEHERALNSELDLDCVVKGIDVEHR
jgi:hypothetical protein